MSRIGFGRRGAAAPAEDDPLDGLVNLFDLGLVLAVAFLVAGLSIGGAARETAEATSSAPTTPSKTVDVPKDGRRASGQGAPVGTVYRLPDGTYVIDESSAPTP